MTFLHPQLLYGLTGVAIPVIIHLLARRRARRQPFPSLRLLKAAQKRRRTLSRLQRPLSLLLRMLAVALLALALAGPAVGPLPAWVPLPRPQALAIVLDDSPSMAGSGTADSPFERGKRAAEALLARLGPTDRVALLPTSAPHAPLTSPRRAARTLPSLTPSARAGKVAPVLLAAAELLRAAEAPNRAIVVVTDGQATAWRQPPVDAEQLRGLPVTVVDVGDLAVTNLSVDEVEVLTPAPVVGRPLRIAATAAASQGEAAEAEPQRVVLQLLSGGRAVAASEEEVAPGRPALVQFSLLPEAAEDLELQVALVGGPHGLPGDDVRVRTVRVRAALGVLVVTPGGAAGAPAVYLGAALDPFRDPGRSGAGTTAIRLGELPAALSQRPADVVILADCPRLDEAAGAALVSHLRAGGGILVFLGNSIEAPYYEAKLIPQLTGDTDLQLGAVSRAQDAAPYFLSEISTSRPPLSAFAGTRAGDLGSLGFERIQQITTGEAADVLARFDTGTPALIQWRTDGGRLVLINTSADDSWGKHVREAAYVPLLHALCSHVARPPGPAIADVLVGERPAITSVGPLPSQVTLVGPNGTEQRVPGEDGLLPEVNDPGVYHATWGEHTVSFAANLDPGESDVSRIGAEALRESLGPAQASILRAQEAAGALRLPARADLSLPLLLLALAVILFEAVFSLVHSGRDEGRGETAALVARYE